MTSTEEFVAFAEAAAPQLRRTAFLLCGNWHTAEDLAQTALARVFVSWRKIRRQDAAHAYATRTLINCYLADRRLKRAVEVLTERFPERPVAAPSIETRLMVLAALAMLPPRSRAVVVLRYWADLSVDQVAVILGCSPGNVRSQSARTPATEMPTVSKTMTVDAALEVALRDDGAGTPVLDGNDLVGVITLGDIGKVIHAASGGLASDPVGAHMRDPVYVTADTPIDVVRRVIAQDGAGLAVVLTAGGRVAGYVTAAHLSAEASDVSPSEPRASRC
jgi:RNA polymerase sigma-70 factor (sigma-E family)